MTPAPSPRRPPWAGRLPGVARPRLRRWWRPQPVCCTSLWSPPPRSRDRALWAGICRKFGRGRAGAALVGPQLGRVGHTPAGPQLRGPICGRGRKHTREPASPGESIPAAWKNFLQASLSSMIQSPRSDLARAPAKEWYVSPASNDGTSSRHRCSTNSKICFGVMSRSSGLCMSRAVGPSIRLPQRVVCTSTPLPFTGSGAGKRVAPARWPWDLFNIR
mmetsp:Transcript_39196/g.124770  ORF Transcript_39196/g.124770 Transcript_39196/m.124770 type:complete len:218 (+) Transcript_39196:2293-2946(+)